MPERGVGEIDAGGQLQHHGQLPGAQPRGAGRPQAAWKWPQTRPVRRDRARPARRYPAAAGLAGARSARRPGGGAARAARAQGADGQGGRRPDRGPGGACGSCRAASTGPSWPEGGLAPALKALARRSAVLVELEVDARSGCSSRSRWRPTRRLRGARQHGQARPCVGGPGRGGGRDGLLRLSVRDDGVGGATPGEAPGSSASPTGSRRWVGPSRSTVPPGRAPPPDRPADRRVVGAWQDAPARENSQAGPASSS